MGYETRGRLKPTAVAAVLYAALGIGFGALRFDTHELQVGSRLLAWLLAAAVFLLHVRSESANSASAGAVARDASRAVAAGAFLLAAWINVYNHLIGAGQAGPLSPLALLVILPLITGVPAFVVAFAVAAAIRRRRTTGGSHQSPPEQP